MLLDATNPEWSDDELDYLRTAFIKTEEMWANAVERVSHPRIILLGEAPLFGETRNYIYSRDAPPTSFLRPTDFEGVSLVGGHRGDKDFLMELMEKFGVVVVDIFPYALNPLDTRTLDYGKINQRNKLLAQLVRNIFPVYAAPKIQWLLGINPDLQALVRYKRLWKPVAPLLEDLGFQPHVGPLGYSCVGSTNMGIDRESLAQALQLAE